MTDVLFYTFRYSQLLRLIPETQSNDWNRKRMLSIKLKDVMWCHQPFFDPLHVSSSWECSEGKKSFFWMAKIQENFWEKFLEYTIVFKLTYGPKSVWKNSWTEEETAFWINTCIINWE